MADHDIFFLSNDEPVADDHWSRLIDRFPRAKRVHGIDGIAEAHKEAAKRSLTDYFWVVDADNIVLPDFDFRFHVPDSWRINPTLVVFRSVNSATGSIYGHGGVKLLPKDVVLGHDGREADFTFSLKCHKIVSPRVSSLSVVDSTPEIAWRSAFREAYKLQTSILVDGKKHDVKMRKRRLDEWLTASGGSYPHMVRKGASAGRDTAMSDFVTGRRTDINDYEYLKKLFLASRTSSINTTDVLRNIELVNPIPGELAHLADAMDAVPDFPWNDLLSVGQLKSKMRLIERVSEIGKFDRCLLSAGWVGFHGWLMRNRGIIKSFDVCDIDETITSVTVRFTDGDVKVCDIMDVDHSSYDLVINTSCEHIPRDRLGEWIRKVSAELKGVLVLQTNDYDRLEEHVNTVRDLNEFEAFLKETGVEPSFMDVIDAGDYNRFMAVISFS